MRSCINLVKTLIKIKSVHNKNHSCIIMCNQTDKILKFLFLARFSFLPWELFQEMTIFYIISIFFNFSYPLLLTGRGLVEFFNFKIKESFPNCSNFSISFTAEI